MVVRSINPKAPWFVGNAKSIIGTPDIPPSCVVTGMREDEDGLLWVFVSVPGPHWRDAWANVPRGRSEISMKQFGIDKLWTTVIEVIDPRTLRLIAHEKLAEWAVSPLSDHRLAVRRFDADGAPQVAIFQLTLSEHK
jgi:hypothetical protein